MTPSAMRFRARSSFQIWLRGPHTYMGIPFDVQTEAHLEMAVQKAVTARWFRLNADPGLSAQTSRYWPLSNRSKAACPVANRSMEVDNVLTSWPLSRRRCCADPKLLTASARPLLARYAGVPIDCTTDAAGPVAASLPRHELKSGRTGAACSLEGGTEAEDAACSVHVGGTDSDAAAGLSWLRECSAVTVSCGFR